MSAILAFVALLSIGQTRAMQPWESAGPCAHAHNDYDQARPLFSALENRFRSVEADVFPIKGDLWVGHDRLDMDAARTLIPMYVKPLADEVLKHHGSVYGDSQELELLIDIKEDGPKSYEVLKRILEPFVSILTSYDNGKVTTRAIKIVLSGERPIAVLAAERHRFAFIDGRVEDIYPTETSAGLISLISTEFGDLFSWHGLDAFTAKDRLRLRHLVRCAHEAGQAVRFWGTPDDPQLWQLFVDEKVDVIGTDNHPALAAFLREIVKH